MTFSGGSDKESPHQLVSALPKNHAFYLSASFFLDFSKKNFGWESAIFLCYFGVLRFLRHLPGKFFTFLAADWRRMALVLFCVGEEGGGVFFGSGDFAAEHAGEFFDALFGF